MTVYFYSFLTWSDHLHQTMVIFHAAKYTYVKKNKTKNILHFLKKCLKLYIWDQLQFVQS